MRWDEVIGQERIKAHLRGLIACDRVPHALMLCGVAGAGELPLALAFAHELLSSSEQSERLADTYQHPDLHFVFPTIKKKTGDAYMREWCDLLQRCPYFQDIDWLAAMGAEKEQAMIYEAESQRVISELSLKASMHGRKVLIVWRPEKMNAVCANKLLKLIEEPPEDTVIIFVSEAPEQLLPTIQSRVQRVQVPPLAEEEIVAGLQALRGTDDAKAARLAHLSRGSMAQALALADMNGADADYLEFFMILMRKAYTRQVADLRQWAMSMSDLGRERQKAFLDFSSRFVRENFMYNFHDSHLVYLNEEEEEFARNFSRFINEANVLDIMGELDTAARDIEMNVNARFVFFDLALQMIILLINGTRI